MKTKYKPVWVVGSTCQCRDEEGHPMKFNTGLSVTAWFETHDPDFTGVLFTSQKRAKQYAEGLRLNTCMVLCAHPEVQGGANE